MGTQRIYIGQIGGRGDVRIARRGYWAAGSDVNDKRQISFAASRPSYADQSEAGFLTQINVWQTFATAFGDLPVVLFSLSRDGALKTGENARLQSPQADYVNATSLCIAIQANGMMATRPANPNWGLPMGPGDRFNYLCVA